MTALIIVLIGMGLILGFFTRQQAFKKLGRVLLLAAISPVLLGISTNYFYQLTIMQKIIVILIATPVVIIILMRIVLSKDSFNEIMGKFIYNTIKAVMSFPFMIIASLIKKYK